MSNVENSPGLAEPPAGSPSKKADKSTLAKGCAIGCGVLIVLGIFGGIGGYFLVQSFMDKMGTALADQLTEEFDVMRDTGQVPEEHAALYQELVDLISRSGTTLTTAMVTSTIVRTNLEDGKVTAEEQQEAEDMRDFLLDNPEAGVFAVDAFIRDHPGLKDRVEEAQRTVNPSTLLGPK